MNDEIISIDGSHGEGGGQIVRSAVGLAAVTGRSVTVENIRAGRKKPGLGRQHLTAVEAAAQICGADVKGAAVGSRTVTFQPRGVRGGAYRFSVGSAGSATLVLQTVLPALLTADGPSRLVLEGGTHNPWAPPFDFLRKAFLPLVNRMGPHVEIALERYGFYPAGGGRLTATIEPSQSLAGFDLLERGEITGRAVRVLLSNLPAHIAERELETIASRLEWDPGCFRVDEVRAQGPGNVVMIEVAAEHVTEVFTAFGRRGIRAEYVAAEAADEASDYLEADVPVGPHLADQLLLPLGLSVWQTGGGGRQRGGAFRALPLTAHSHTHLEVLRKFIDMAAEVEPSPDGKSCTVRVLPATA